MGAKSYLFGFILILLIFVSACYEQLQKAKIEDNQTFDDLKKVKESEKNAEVNQIQIENKLDTKQVKKYPYAELKNVPYSRRCKELEKIAWGVYTDDGFYDTKLLPDWVDKCENFVADSFGGGGILTLREQLDFQNQYFKGMMEARERGEILGNFFNVPNNDIYYYDKDIKKWIKTNVSVNMSEYSKPRNDTEPLDVWLRSYKNQKPNYIQQEEKIHAQTITQNVEVKEFKITAKQFAFEPSTIEVNKGDKVRLIVTSMDVPHGIAISEYGVNERLNPGEPVTIEFTAEKEGTFTTFCSQFCGSGHGNMKGKIIVK